MKRVFYGWFVCAGCALLLFCTSGLAVNAFSIYQPYIISQNAFTNTQASALLTCRNLASLCSMLPVGKYYRGLGFRRGMTLAGALMALSFLLYGLAPNYAGYCLAAVLSGIGYGTGTMIPVTMLINRWFVDKKDTAIGVCSAVTGISTLGIPSLLSDCIEKNGLRPTFLGEAAVIFILVAIVFFLLRNTPEEMGTVPYREAAGRSGCANDTPEFRRDLSRIELTATIFTLLLIGGVMNVSYSHLTVLITGEGLQENTAALAMSISGLSLMFGKILYGRLEDRWGTVKCNFAFAPLLLTGLALLCFVGRVPFLLWPAMILYSFGISCLSVGLSTWPGELSSPRRHGRLVQIFQVGYAAGSLLFSPLPGILADRSGGSYVPAFRLFLLLSLAVFFMVQWILLRGRKAS